MRKIHDTFDLEVAISGLCLLVLRQGERPEIWIPKLGAEESHGGHSMGGEAPVEKHEVRLGLDPRHVEATDGDLPTFRQDIWPSGQKSVSCELCEDKIEVVADIAASGSPTPAGPTDQLQLDDWGLSSARLGIDLPLDPPESYLRVVLPPGEASAAGPISRVGGKAFLWWWPADKHVQPLADRIVVRVRGVRRAAIVFDDARSIRVDPWRVDAESPPVVAISISNEVAKLKLEPPTVDSGVVRHLGYLANLGLKAQSIQLPELYPYENAAGTRCERPICPCAYARA